MEPTSWQPLGCRKRRLAALLLGLSLLGCQPGHGSQEQDAASRTTSESTEFALRPMPTRDDGSLDVSGGPVRVVEVPAVGWQPTIVHTPNGYFALSVDWGGRTLEGARSALYRSQDGVHWTLVPLGAAGNPLLGDLAYGAGHFVMTGRNEGTPVLWHSTDGELWQETAQGVDSSVSFQNVVYLGDRFIAFGFRNVGVSTDGQHFSRTTVDLVQLFGAAYGDGRYLLTGSGPTLLSTDGETWEAHDVDCALPNVCVSDPDGVAHQTLTAPLFYGADAFHYGQLQSQDGTRWSVSEQGPVEAYIGGFFVHEDADNLLAYSAVTTAQQPTDIAITRPSAWAASAKGRDDRATGLLARDEPLPVTVDASFEDGLSCEQAYCFVLGGRLLMLPPPGTPPLPDHEPRTADGSPLLSDECPYSRMVFCTDYKERSGCHCVPTAPSGPDACADVSQFECAGAFEHNAEEWPLTEVAEGGAAATESTPTNHRPSACRARKMRRFAQHR